MLNWSQKQTRRLVQFLENRYATFNVFNAILQLNSPMLHYQMIFKDLWVRGDLSGAHKDSGLTDPKSARNAQVQSPRGASV